jgi:hypothetical protein
LNRSFPVFILGWTIEGKSGRGLPQSKTWRKFGAAPANAKRLGVRQPSGALERSARGWAMTEIKLGAHSALLAASKQLAAS